MRLQGRYSQSVYNLDAIEQVNQTRRIQSYINSNRIPSRREGNVYYTPSEIQPPPQYVITTKGRIIQTAFLFRIRRRDTYNQSNI